MSSRPAMLLTAAVLAALALAPLLFDLPGDILNLAILLFIYTSLAQSWNLVGGYAGQINLGLAAFFGCGVLTTHFSWAAGAPFGLALLAGGLAAAVLALIIGLPTLRLRGVYFSMGTLALAEALRITVGNVFTRTVYMPVPPAEYTLRPRSFMALGVLTVCLAAVFFLARSRPGLAMEALREDEDAAAVSGINIVGFRLFAFVASSFLAGLTGGVYAYYQMSILPLTTFLPLWTFEPAMAASIGGAGTFIGPIIGSIFLVVLREVFALNLGQAHLIIYGAAFILVVLFLPHGLVQLGRVLGGRPGRKPAVRPGRDG